ncbi:MAG TPA: hypothetical protein VF136_13950 [Methylomirabilota bacterium]
MSRPRITIRVQPGLPPPGGAQAVRAQAIEALAAGHDVTIPLLSGRARLAPPAGRRAEVRAEHGGA